MREAIKKRMAAVRVAPSTARRNKREFQSIHGSVGQLRECGGTPKENMAYWAFNIMTYLPNSARQRGIPFNLTEFHFVRLAQQTDGRCQLTGIPFQFTGDPRFHRNPFRPSVDRIDSSRGYEIDNIRIVCTAVNTAMGEWGEDVFRQILKGYTETILSSTVPFSSKVRD